MQTPISVLCHTSIRCSCIAIIVHMLLEQVYFARSNLTKTLPRPSGGDGVLSRSAGDAHDVVYHHVLLAALAVAVMVVYVAPMVLVVVVILVVVILVVVSRVVVRIRRAGAVRRARAAERGDARLLGQHSPRLRHGTRSYYYRFSTGIGEVAAAAGSGRRRVLLDIRLR